MSKKSMVEESQNEFGKGKKQCMIVLVWDRGKKLKADKNNDSWIMAYCG